MRGFRAIAALFLLTTAMAHAQVTGTVTAVSDYDFRGISLSATDPAIQGSIDWAHESGLYVGAWGSCCLDFGPGTDTENEIDLYGGFTGSAEGGFGWDVGFVYYSYWPDGDELDYPELYVGGSYGPVKARLWYTNDYNNLDVDAYYLEGNGSFALPENFTLNVHLGYNFGDYWEDVFGDEALDYSVGVGYPVGNFTLNLRYVDMESDVEIESDELNNEGRVIFSIATTFPWASE